MTSQAYLCNAPEVSTSKVTFGLEKCLFLRPRPVTLHPVAVHDAINKQPSEPGVCPTIDLDSASSPKKSGTVQRIVTFIGATTPHADPRLIGDHEDFDSIESSIRPWSSADVLALLKVGLNLQL